MEKVYAFTLVNSIFGCNNNGMKTNRDMNNAEISTLLRAVAAAYEVEGGTNSRFRIIAYQNAATSIEHLNSEIRDIWKEGDRKSTRLNSSHSAKSRMPSSA